MTPPATLTSEEAAAFLGVKPATLYSYVSRGLVRTVPDPDSARRRRYLRDDVLALKARHDARSGHGPVAAAAMAFGEPVVDSAITRIDPVRGPLYRGRGAVELARSGVSFEEAVTWLLGAAPPADLAEPSPPGALDALLEGPLGRAASPTQPAARLAVALAAAAVLDHGRYGAPQAAELRRAWRILGLVARYALGGAPAQPSLAATLLVAAGQAPSPQLQAALDAALVVCADHELNASTFAARVAASTGADLYACVAAALGALSGPLHGGATLRVEALLDEALRAPDAHAALRDRMLRGEALPGFGHRLYAEGDPRVSPLLEHALALSGSCEAEIDRALELAEVAVAAGHPQPTLDFGLVVLARACGLPRGAALGIFALGRTAGWLAHVFEQREQPGLLRPRARYTGTQD